MVNVAITILWNHKSASTDAIFAKLIKEADRGINLLNIAYKILVIIMAKRLKTHVISIELTNAVSCQGN